MKRKLLSILLCTALTAALLSGCGNSSEPADSTSGETADAAEETGGDDDAGAVTEAASEGKTKVRMTYWNSEDTIQALLDYLAEEVPDVEN